MPVLAENVLHFARILRGAGLPIGTDRVMDAVRALPLAGIESRRDWHATLSALFLTRHEQQVIFDEAFAVFWRDPALEQRMMAAMLPKVAGRMAGLGARASPRVAEAFITNTQPTPAVENPEQIEVDASLTFTATERLKHLDFEKMTGDEWREAKRIVAGMRLPVPDVRTRRFKRAPTGAAIDLAATLRRLARDGGQIARIVRREPRLRAPPIVVLCDISGSMHRYSRMFLHFLHALVRDRARVSVLLFGTRLTNVTRALRHRDVDEAVDAVCAAVPDWAGGTRIASCVHEFNFQWSRRLLGQNATLLLVTDGLDRDDAPGLEVEMARLHRSSHRLLWLNPLLRYEGFEPRASGIVAMRPHVDAFLPVHNLESLRTLGKALSPHSRLSS
ncbi:vWA domain-containing protein [Usitatibacter palustris]|uniref:VWFA domain-containing protein n=1 Tax=Usitatibacter palustris TaxID=2732487 RepID=A0A6M4H784_9PROT|nr:VWA domain-containing protein [Usitatibacter palustris]QJR14778.1 hypothetical protein DSM104440_01588 [Usitatibacter palustris]